MSVVGLGMDALLGLLLVAALAVGVRLNGKLTTLRTGQAGFVKAVGDLDAAAMRAEAGLAALRAATLDAHDHLLDRIETARALADRLEHAVGEAETARQRADYAASEDRARARSFTAPQTEPSSVRRPDASQPPVTPPLRVPGAALARFVARRDARAPERPA